MKNFFKKNKKKILILLLLIILVAIYLLLPLSAKNFLVSTVFYIFLIGFIITLFIAAE